MIDSFAGRFVDGGIECEADAATIAQSVHANGVALLTGVFPREPLARMRQTVFEWGLANDPLVESDVSFHRIDHLPAKSKTPHIFHAFNLYLREGAIEPRLDRAIRPFFTAMKGLQNALTGNDADFTLDAGGRFLRPQLLQYPSGGGFFEQHFHPYLPQKIGLITGLSEQGTDFDSGGTCFEFGGRTIRIEGRHHMGDIAMFRYDIPHWISPIDADKRLDWRSQRGRWTMVLPYY